MRHPSQAFRTLAPHADGPPSDAPDARIGAVVAGRYRVERLLGAGGVGRVYAARHLELDEHVAIKFLLAEWSARLEMRARFQREAVVLARLRHPGIVSVLDFGEDGGEPYLVMEYLRGRGLETEVLVDDMTMPVERAAAVMDQVLQVLEVAHAAGVVHRDLKPENVMLVDPGDRTERVKVLDFGIAAVSEPVGAARLTATGAMHGTPYYMSPEQCAGRVVGPPTDVYAAGVVLFELLTGRLPFDGASVAEVLAQQIFAAPPRLADAGTPRPVPAGLEALVHRALAKRPEDRPTAAALRDALALAARGADGTTRVARDAAERARVAGLSRTDRALAPAAPPPPPATVGLDGLEVPRVALWGFAPARAAVLRTALAVTGVEATAWPGDAPPPDARGLRAVVIAGDARAAARTAALRAAPHALPVVVLDVADAAAAPALIRAGASDVALDRVDDPAACAKVARVLRRGR